MRLSSIPGLMSICILLTHSSRYILSAQGAKVLSQVFKSQAKSGKAQDESQSSQSQPKPAPKVSSSTSSSASGRPAVTVSQSSKPTDTSTPSTPPSESSESKSSTPSSTSEGQTSQGSEDTNATPSTPASQPSVTCDQSSPSSPVHPVEHPTDLKIFTEGNSQANDNTKYELKQYGRYYKFEFKDNVKCTKVMYESDTLYEFGKSEPKDKHPKEIYFNTETYYVYIGLYKTKYVERYEFNDWKCETGTIEKKISASKFKIVTDGSTAENDNTKFDETNDGSFVKCEFKEGINCSEIKYDNQKAYKHDSSKHEGKHPKCLYFHKYMKVVFIVFDNDVIWLLRFDLDTKSWHSEKLENSDSFNADSLKVLTPDPNDNNNEKENDTDSLDKKSIHSITGFIVKKNVDYFLFKYGDEIVISFYNYYGRPKLKEIYFLLNSKKNLALLEDKCLYFFNG